MMNQIKSMFGIKSVEFYHKDTLVYQAGKFDDKKYIWTGEIRGFK